MHVVYVLGKSYNTVDHTTTRLSQDTSGDRWQHTDMRWTIVGRSMASLGQGISQRRRDTRRRRRVFVLDCYAQHQRHYRLRTATTMFTFDG